MDATLSNVAENMLFLGRATLAHAIDMLTFHNSAARYNRVEQRDSIAVLTAAHAAEILVKSRIAQEHPLLIFKEIPKRSRASENSLTLSQLMEDGRTLMFSELPDRLWAVSGYDLPSQETYQSFGKLRNTIQHFGRPDRNLTDETIKFIFTVIQPFLWEHWNLLAIEHFDDPDGHEYVLEFVSKFPVNVQLRESWRRYAERLNSEELDRLIFISDESCSTLRQFHSW
ncbi:hypothetical protein H6F95_21515 [Cyanobacteria bacterium FACHB-471]|nr:hypothetical protein [Cyanobacteria bacterium FACHB-471]